MTIFSASNFLQSGSLDRSINGFSSGTDNFGSYQYGVSRQNSEREERASTRPMVLSSGVAGVLIAAGGLGVFAQGAIAQTTSSTTANGSIMTFEADNGRVEIDINAFDLETGPQENSSNIPLPIGLPERTEEGVALPVDRSRLAPNTVNLTTDVPYIEQAFQEAVRNNGGSMDFTFDPNSVNLNAEFDLDWRPGSHDFGEGIEVTVRDADGNERNQQRAFVRGDLIQRGPNNEVLPESARINVSYDSDETVELRFLNLRREGREAFESGVYFSESGEFIVEDLQDGGDLDFDDGEYVEISGGEGEADALRETTTTEVEEEVTETPLEPLTREERTEESVEEVTTVIEMDAVSEEVVDRGEIEIPDSISTLLGHATGARAETGEQLIYDRYTAAAQANLGSDGIGLTGQLAPLFSNPSAPPTLLGGNVRFNPFVDDNEAGFTATVGVTQYLTRTHRQATDGTGAPIFSPDGRRMLEPTGLFTSGSTVSYVPPSPDELVMGDPIPSVNGVFELPFDQQVVVSSPEPSLVGRGNAAYTNNVGGLLLESAQGGLSFVPQWNETGYEQSEITLEPGEVSRIIYALVPQQSGQDLQLGQQYAVTEGSNGYVIADGGFIVISADRQPENFQQEQSEVYAVEDTLPERVNAVTALFNGIRGTYTEEIGGIPMRTFDVDLFEEVDARVGNTLVPVTRIPGDPPQFTRRPPTIAAGLYLGGALTGGIGNQRDSIIETDSTMIIEQDEIRRTFRVDTFSIPRVQRETVVTETTTTRQQEGQARFDINERGELTNARFLEGEELTVDVNTRELDRFSEIEEGEEELVSTRQEEVFEPIERDEDGEPTTNIIMADQDVTERDETEANFAPVRGELTLGGILNFGNTPWSAAANTIRAELFARDTVFGRDTDDGGFGWRAELVFNPFGERRREAFQYDENGQLVPVYQIEAAFDDEGNRLTETLIGEGGEPITIPASRYVRDELGELIPQKVGTGEARGPGVYLRVEDAFDDGDGVQFAGGLEYNF